MPTPDDSQTERRFLSLDRRTYLRLQAAGIIATGVGSAQTEETGYGVDGFGEGEYGAPTDDTDDSDKDNNGKPPDHANSRFSSISSSSTTTRFSSASSADYQ